ncbi:MAG: hypothetical protein HQ538_01505 [Parcubacteria group bacterium]|nr:hypothetical protein [Parcubacteria group bacterium]
MDSAKTTENLARSTGLPMEAGGLVKENMKGGNVLWRFLRSVVALLFLGVDVETTAPEKAKDKPPKFREGVRTFSTVLANQRQPSTPLIYLA